MRRNRTSEVSGGVGLSSTSALTIAFIVLKLCGVIQWSWLWVLSPVWISCIILIIVFLCVFLFDR